jgi:hypothetical protein
MKPRTLIIGAKDTADFIRAGHLVKQYIEGGFADRVPSGRYHGVIYGHRKGLCYARRSRLRLAHGEPNYGPFRGG